MLQQLHVHSVRGNVNGRAHWKQEIKLEAINSIQESIKLQMHIFHINQNFAKKTHSPVTKERGEHHTSYHINAPLQPRSVTARVTSSPHARHLSHSTHHPQNITSSSSQTPHHTVITHTLSHSHHTYFITHSSSHTPHHTLITHTSSHGHHTHTSQHKRWCLDIGP